MDKVAVSMAGFMALRTFFGHAAAAAIMGTIYGAVCLGFAGYKYRRSLQLRRP
jgi:hypothetical protein